MADRDDILKERQEKEYLGVWWIPSDGGEQRNVSGVMRIAEGEKLDLQLLGTFSPGERRLALMNYPVVNGASHGLNRFTFFDVSAVGLQSNGSEPSELDETKLWCLEGWVGPGCYAKKEDIAFFSLCTGMFGLSAWHNVNPFSVDYDLKGHKANLSYKRPEDVLLFEDGNVTISVGYAWKGPTQSIGQTEADVRHEAQFVIKSRSGKLPFYGEDRSYEFYLKYIRTIIGLMTGAPAPLYNCTGVLQRHEMPHDGKPFVPEIVLKHTWRRDMPKLPEKGLSPLDVLVPYAKLGSVREVVGNFFKLPKLARDFAGHLVYLNGCGSNMTQGVLSELVFMFEGIHRELYDANEKTWLILRFIDELNRQADVFPYLGDDELGLSLVIFIKKRRDNYSHANPDDYHNEFRLFMFAKMWMHQFITAMILVKCGISPKDLYKSFAANHLYAELSRELPGLIRHHRNLYSTELAETKKNLLAHSALQANDRRKKNV